MNKPVIGITTGGRSETYVMSRHYDAFYSVPTAYADAVRRAGGLPLLIPPGDAEWVQMLRLLDGLVITGGTDIDPAEYQGDAQNPNLLPADHERDQSELAFARHLLAEKERPLLGICRGMQVLNVAAGGSLYEHIPDIRDTDIHRSDAGIWAMQHVSVTEGSLLAEIMGTTVIDTQSGHHQAIREVGAGLEVVGMASDGIIEALEMPDHNWLIAVQWHPEVTAAEDLTQQALFDALVEKASQRLQSKNYADSSHLTASLAK